MNQIAELLPVGNVALDVDAATKSRLFDVVAQLFERDIRLPPREIVASLAAREKLGSTGLGQGIAIPHGRLKRLGESRAALEGLALRLVDHAGARARKRQVQEALSAIKRFFEEEAGALARARAATGFRPYPVPQQDRDLLFARCRARPLPA